MAKTDDPGDSTPNRGSSPSDEGDAELVSARVVLAGNEDLQRAMNSLAQTQRALHANTLMKGAVANLVADSQRAFHTSTNLHRALANLAQTQRALVVNPALRSCLAQLAEIQAAQMRPLHRFVAQLQARQAPILRQPAAMLRSLPATPPGGTSPTTALAPVQPWRETAVVLRRRMFTLLIKLDPGLMVRLEGAWERVVRGGPHSSSQAAHSAVELVDWCLRSGAPDTDTLAWHTEQHRPADEIANGRPTRPLRMRYILRERDPDGAIASAYVRHAQEVIEHLQEIKHTEAGASPRELAALVMSIENVLIFLFSPN